MHKHTQALKVSTLALVLSFGLSYVYAWTAPTVSAPGGNVAAPINTSAVSQTKTGDIAVNNATHFLDTGTTIPETPAGGNGAVALNGWPNYSDVAANAVKLAGLTSADILSAQTAGGTSGTVSDTLVFYSGSAVCPTGWTKAFTGRTTEFAVNNGTTLILPIAVNGGTNDVIANGGPIIGCADGASGTGGWGRMYPIGTTASCTVCAR